jgi:hypothetical protein
MFEHCRRLVFIAHELVKQIIPYGLYNPDPAKDLPEIKTARERTQEMQSIFLALVEAAKEESDEDEEE